MYDDYALVTSYLGDFRIPVKYIFSIKNVEGLPVLVTLNTGESFQYTFKSADSNVLVFQSGERTLSFPWETVKDCIFLDP